MQCLIIWYRKAWGKCILWKSINIKGVIGTKTNWIKSVFFLGIAYYILLFSVALTLLGSDLQKGPGLLYTVCSEVVLFAESLWSCPMPKVPDCSFNQCLFFMRLVGCDFAHDKCSWFTFERHAIIAAMRSLACWHAAHTLSHALLVSSNIYRPFFKLLTWVTRHIYDKAAAAARVQFPAKWWKPLIYPISLLLLLLPAIADSKHLSH